MAAQENTAKRNRTSCTLAESTQITGHKTESVYRRYAIVSERDVAEGLERLGAFLGEDELGSGS